MKAKVGRNEPCPCGSGKKHKKCCLTKGKALAGAPEAPVAARFKFEPSIYADPAGCMPSIECLIRTPSGWDWYSVLAKVDDPMDEAAALSVATADLEEATSKRDEGGSDESFAMLLKDRGYLTVDGFDLVGAPTDGGPQPNGRDTGLRSQSRGPDESPSAGPVAAVHDRIDATILPSADPSFVLAGSRQAGIRCRLERSDPCCGGEREVAIVAQPVGLDSSGHTTETGDPPLEMRVGIDCGYLYYAAGGLVEPSACDIPGLAELQAALDGQVLDALARRWLAERGKACKAGTQRPDTDDLDWEPGMPLGWSDAFEELREENLHGSLGCYAVFDLYFIEPGSDPPEVIIHFGEGPHHPTREAGGIRVDLETDGIELMPDRGRGKLLRKLWDQYRQRYPDLSHLRARWPQMRQFGIGFCENRS